MRFLLYNNVEVVVVNNDVLKDNLVFLRKKKNLTQKELARELNYSDKVISKWERGESRPPIDALNHLVDYYGCSLDELVNHPMDEDIDEKETYRIDVVEEHGPSKLGKASILLPFVFWIIASVVYGPMYFVLFGLGFVLCLIVYGIYITNVQFVSHYGEHTIRVMNKYNKLELFIDDQLVDGCYSLFAFQARMTGKVDQKKIKVNLSFNIFVRCVMFVE
jgi:transcriptional regulator with XRE-family HTH domain